MRINHTLTPNDITCPAIMEPDTTQNVTISVCMIVRDEDENLKELLPTLGFADEIVIVDTDPKGPITISKSSSNWALNLYVTYDWFPWNDSFADARNYAKSKCTKDLILWLDADDRLPQATIDALETFKKTAKSTVIDAVQFFDVVMTHDGKPTGCRVSQPRLFPNHDDIVWRGKVHETIGESIGPKRKIVTDIQIHHTGYDDTKLLLKKTYRNLDLLEQMDGGAKVNMELGNCYDTLGSLEGDKSNFQKAIGHYKKAVDFIGNQTEFNDHVLYLMGKSYMNLGDWENALIQYRLSGKPDSTYGIAACLNNLGKHDKALEMYLKYLTEDPKSDFFGSLSTILRESAYKKVMEIMQKKYAKEYPVATV